MIVRQRDGEEIAMFRQRGDRHEKPRSTALPIPPSRNNNGNVKPRAVEHTERFERKREDILEEVIWKAIDAGPGDRARRFT